MSFGYNAVGTSEQAAAQLENAPIGLGEKRFNEFGAELRDLLVKHLTAENVSASTGYEYRYTVKANGHGGGNVPLSLQLTVEPLYVAVGTTPDAGDED